MILLRPNFIKLFAIHSLHYFEFTKKYSFPGEKHNFWELQYVDKGNYTVTADGHPYKLSQGQIIFHRPNEYHGGNADGKTNPNLMVLAFSGLGFDTLSGKVLSLSEHQRRHLSEILSVAKNCFTNQLNRENDHEISLSQDADPAFVQSIFIHLESLIISCILNKRKNTPYAPIGTKDTAETIAKYLQTHLCDGVSLHQLETRFHLNRNYLNRLFKAKYGVTAIQYYIQQKIELAKELLRNDQMTIKQIAEELDYSTESYFCKQFSDLTGYTPTEYIHSLVLGSR